MTEKIQLNRLKFLSGSMLKLIAVISMLIDHTAHIFYSELDFLTIPLFALAGREITVYYIMRRIGRLAFPLFCFLVAEGFVHTRNQKKYGLGLLIFALLSEIPFNLMGDGKLIDPSRQNVYFTLFLGFLLIYIFVNTKNELLKFVLMAIVTVISMFLHADYGMRGVLLILLIYALRSRPAIQAVLSYPLLSGGVSAFAAFIPINMYNGQRGFIRSNILKYLFYLFYPLHILLLYGLKTLLQSID